MVNLRDVSTKDLINEIKSREECRSIDLLGDEYYKVQAMKEDATWDRYLRGRGPAAILEVSLDRS